MKHFYQFRAYPQLQRILYLLMLLEYVKALKKITAPVKNIIQATGSAKIKVPTIDPATGVESQTEKDLSNPAIFEIWGVKAEVEPGQIMLINEEGYPVVDMNMQYKIQPTEYKYLPQNLNLDFYEKDKNGNETWMGFIQADANGNLTLSRGTAKFNAENTYYAELVLHRGTRAEIRSEKALIKIAQLYIEKIDPEFPDVKLRWNDYYTALGEKTIAVRSATDTLEGKVVNCEILEPTQQTLNNIAPPPTMPECTPLDERIINGRMRFKLNATTLAPMIGNDQTTGVNEIKLKFSLQENPSRSIEATYNVKNNSNTTLKEVLDGEAVFVYDTLDEDNHKGKTTATVDDNDKKLDFVQKMLNQVVPRKRSATDYIFTEEDGWFYADTYISLVDFKNNFNLNVNDTVGSYTSGTNGIGTYNDNDNTSHTFRKLMKDYGKREATNPWLMDSSAGNSWLHKVIDKETLVGNTMRIQDPSATISAVESDVLINETTGNTRNDTGLYELYKNVVERFVEGMMAEGVRYINATGFSNAEGHWKPRTYNPSNPANGDSAQTVGVSYCFGCKDSIEQFIEYVSSCATPAEGNAPTNYRGRINEASNCAITGGTKGYPGLKDTELNVQSTLQPYWPTYWAGIDCSGFVQRLGLRSQAILNSAFINTNFLALEMSHVANMQRNEMSAGSFTNSTYSYYLRQNAIGKFRRGDFIVYDPDADNTVEHISLIYCTAGDETGQCNDLKEKEYRIIHASGNEQVCECLRWKGNKCMKSNCSGFNRKTVTNTIKKNTLGTLGSPFGFGKIKLWD